MFEVQKKVNFNIPQCCYVVLQQTKCCRSCPDREVLCVWAPPALQVTYIPCLLILSNTCNSYHIYPEMLLPYYCACQRKREITHANCCNFSETLDQNEKKKEGLFFFSRTDFANVNRGTLLIARDSLIIPNNTKYMPGRGKFTPTSISISSS